MSIWPVIKAPIAVQLNRIAFAVYAVFFGWALWRFRHIASVKGTAIFLGMIFLSVLGLFDSCIRARRSRWIMAMLVLLIPGIFFIGLCLTVWSRPEVWLDWLLNGLVAIFVWFGIPITLALSLFMRLYKISSEKRGLAVDIRQSQKCIEYFKGSEDGCQDGCKCG